MDRLTRVTAPQGELFETNYDLAGRTLGRVADNASLSSQTQRSGGAVFNDFDYSYTERGNISDIGEAGEITRTRAYSYDELQQDESYELDPEGNRLSPHLSESNQTDPANRLT